MRWIPQDANLATTTRNALEDTCIKQQTQDHRQIACLALHQLHIAVDSTVTAYPTAPSRSITLHLTSYIQAPCGHSDAAELAVLILHPPSSNSTAHTTMRGCKARRAGSSLPARRVRCMRLVALLLRHTCFSCLRAGTGVSAPNLPFRPSATCVGRRVLPRRDRLQNASVKTITRMPSVASRRHCLLCHL